MFATWLYAARAVDVATEFDDEAGEEEQALVAVVPRKMAMTVERSARVNCMCQVL
jgi:hypothetical protein